MGGNRTPPDYDLADRLALTTPSQVKALSHPLRTTILGLLHERAATVTELATSFDGVAIVVGLTTICGRTTESVRGTVS